MSQIIALTKKFISIPSIKGNSRALKEVLDAALAEVKGYCVDFFEKEGIPSALIYNSKARRTRFKIILNAHLDVVEGKDKQFTPFEKQGKLYGRGAYDMKTAAAAEIILFKRIAKKLNYPIALQLVTDEETGSNGTKFQVEKGVKTDFVIAGEPTDLNINFKAKGTIWAKVKFFGKSAHAAYLWQGRNPIWNLKRFLDSIQILFPLPAKKAWRTTVNIAKVETSNLNMNKVPNNCEVSLDIRYVPVGQNRFSSMKNANFYIKKLKEVLPANAKLELMLVRTPYSIKKEDPYIGTLQEASKKITGKKRRLVGEPYGSDIRYFIEDGSRGITFGPVGGAMHSENEWVDIKSLDQYCKILESFLLFAQKAAFTT
ncbi:hypothetical protein A3F60_00515 [Candidatus Roizmanbacteria bacterium RIFCSPHIGHO2_12_FULL_39_8]|nr:MAG: hypothetical protein A3F60_00515 [Candidatus Roizmanbacteria bacterium RIFCSPHIGHO2_12_FULL_39_8]